MLQISARGSEAIRVVNKWLLPTELAMSFATYKRTTCSRIPISPNTVGLGPRMVPKDFASNRTLYMYVVHRMDVAENGIEPA